MEQKTNYDYLKDQVKFTGFGEVLDEQLKANMEKKLPEFQLQHQLKYGDDKLDVTLYFRKSNDQDNYFLNKYDATLQKDGADELKQTFYTDQRITTKEAYNLLEGRSVEKTYNKHENIAAEGEKPVFKQTDEKYTAWVKLDFKNTTENGNYEVKSFHQNYGFDLNEVLSKHPIKELANDEDKKKLMDSLQKGNRQAVTFTGNGNEERKFIEANPQFKTITIYNASMQRERQSQKEGKGQQQSEKKTAKQSQKAGDDDDEGGTKKNKKKSQGIK